MTITEEAKQELKRIGEARLLPEGRFLRLATPPLWVGPGDWGIVVADEGAHDYEVLYEDKTVLLIDAGLAEEMASAVFDFKDTPQGQGFTLDVF